MKLPTFGKQYKDFAIVMLVSIPVVGLVVWTLPMYEQEYEYTTLKSRMVNADYYLKSATTLDRQSIRPTKRAVDADLHLLISPTKAKEMVADDDILYECEPLQTGCSDETWQSYSSYTAAYGKSYVRTNYQGKLETRTHNPALPNLSHRKDLNNISCAMRQVSADTAYGICVNPPGGDLWYHYYRNW